jgi:hypothetical protein
MLMFISELSWFDWLFIVLFLLFGTIISAQVGALGLALAGLINLSTVLTITLSLDIIAMQLNVAENIRKIVGGIYFLFSPTWSCLSWEAI